MDFQRLHLCLQLGLPLVHCLLCLVLRHEHEHLPDLVGHLLVVVFKHHEVGGGVLKGLDLAALGLGLLTEVLPTVVEAGELVDLLLVLQEDVNLLVL